MVYIIMGVSGSGKTTVGSMLAKNLRLEFYDADDFHLAASIRKMSNGFSLNDSERLPWLSDLSTLTALWDSLGGAVLACSALKLSYRRILASNPNSKVCFIHLAVDYNQVKARFAGRTGHFFPVSLVQSQFDLLEISEEIISVTNEGTPEQTCEMIMRLITGNQ
jgi:carbohydrate kinase (thermoresistant glucokinase family)